uniref:tRNA (guanine(26)-N(2))-dimethyltransferase n=1 Tax=Glossina brevipalpis TaxID=37001 RepID=A0A1A9WAD7_9MUSC
MRSKSSSNVDNIRNIMLTAMKISGKSSLKDGDLLLVTSTDIAVLAGNAPEACYVKYGSVPLRMKSCHEMTLRILLHCIESYANRYEPIFKINVSQIIAFWYTNKKKTIAYKKNMFGLLDRRHRSSTVSLGTLALTLIPPEVLALLFLAGSSSKPNISVNSGNKSATMAS